MPHKNPRRTSRQSGYAPSSTPDLPNIECACSTVRRAARLITQLYDEELRGHLEAPQLALLAGVDKNPGSNQTILARVLGFNKTTISRNLAVMERKGWIEHAVVNDQRERGVRLTAAGRKLLTITKPGWKRAQSRLRSAMGDQQWEAMWEVLRSVTNAAHKARTAKR